MFGQYVMLRHINQVTSQHRKNNLTMTRLHSVNPITLTRKIYLISTETIVCQFDRSKCYNLSFFDLPRLKLYTAIQHSHGYSADFYNSIFKHLYTDIYISNLSSCLVLNKCKNTQFFQKSKHILNRNLCTT